MEKRETDVENQVNEQLNRKEKLITPEALDAEAAAAADRKAQVSKTSDIDLAKGK